MRKKTPRNSSKKSKKSKEIKEKILIFTTFLIFIGVLGYLFYTVNIESLNEDVVAILNGEKITRDQLDWWYKVSILPEYRDIVSRQEFLLISLLPQEALVQEAKKERIKTNKNDVEKLLGLFIIENGLTFDEFDKHLDSRGISLDDIRKTFETRALITGLLEKENINIFDVEEQELFFENKNNDFQIYLDDLMNRSEIEIFQENIDKIVLRNFEKIDDELCSDERLTIRLFTVSKCKICEESGNTFKEMVDGPIKEGSIQAHHWSLDTGDDLLTLKKEKGIPMNEVNFFKRNSPDKLVPTVIMGCEYKRIGSFGIEEEEEFKIILDMLMGE